MRILAEIGAVALAAAYVIHEIRADRRVRAFFATPVQIVSPPAPRWWRRAFRSVAEALIGAAFLAALIWVAAHLHTGTEPARHMPTVPIDTDTHTAPAGAETTEH